MRALVLHVLRNRVERYHRSHVVLLYTTAQSIPKSLRSCRVRLVARQCRDG